jgi:hypothetical protein
MKLGISPTIVHANDLHARLFLHVMQLVSQPGRKQLRQETLDSLTSLGTMTEQERAIINVITTQVFRLEERFAALADTVAQHQVVLDALQAELQSRAESAGVATQVSAELPIVSTSVPPKVVTLCRRQDTVRGLVSEMSRRRWTALHGTTGIGKTQLSTLLADTTCGQVVHLSLRDLTSGQAYLRLCAFFAQIAEACDGRTFEIILAAAVNNLGRQCLIIVDDLPHLDGRDQLSLAIISLARALMTCDGHLITTSYHLLPSGVLECFTNSAAENVPCPSFSDDEAIELFAAHGAPTAFRESGKVRLINLFTSGNAALLAGYARNLANRDWHWEASDTSLLKVHHHAQDVIDEAVRRLLDTVSDSRTRNLLYRLCPVLGSFTQREIDAVAHVEPCIDRPRERLATLTGVWIEQRAEGRLSVSPIVKPLSSSELSADVRKGVFAALSDSLIARRSLNVLEFAEAAHYIEQGENFTRLGLYFCAALTSSASLPPEQLESLLLVTKAIVTLPDQMDLALRLLLRAQQIQVSHRLSRPIGWLLEDLDQLIESAGSREQWAVYVASAITVGLVAETDFQRSLRYLDHALRYHDEVMAMVHGIERSEDRIGKTEPVSPRNMIWINTTGVHSVEDLTAWISFLDTLNDELLAGAFSHEWAAIGAISVVDRPWMVELDKPVEQRKWGPIVEAYDAVIDFAERRGLERLWSAAIRAKIICVAEYVGDLASASRIADSAVMNALCESPSQFLIRDVIGRQFLFAGKAKDATLWLTSAVEEDFNLFPVIATRSFLELSRAIGDSDPPRAAEIAKHAVEFARTQPTSIPEVEMAAILAEYGLAGALAGNVTDAFAAFDEAAERLIDCRDESIQWKQRLVMLAYSTRYFASIARCGNPPTAEATDTPDKQPVRGATISPHEKCAQYYDEQNFALIGIAAFCPLISIYAEAVGNHERCAEWALRGLAEARTHGLQDSIGILGQRAYPWLAMRGQVAEALETAFESMVSLDCCRALEASGASLHDLHVASTDVLGPKPSSKWNEIERIVAQAGVLPIVMEIGRVALTQPERATSYGLALAEASATIANTASDPELWRETSQIVTKIFVDPIPEEAHAAQGGEAREKGQDLTCVLSYLGCTLVPNATLERSAIYHAVVIEYVYKAISPRAAAYSTLVVPFLCQYWQYMLQTQRFRFSNPDWVGEQLAAALICPIESRAQRVLSVVIDGLRQRLPENLSDVQHWLKSGA